LEAQNLVPNPSFENFVNFDSTQSKGWHKVQNSDSPDYFNLGNQSYNNIFNQYIGGVKPIYGEAYAGIFCYRINPSRRIKNIREYIETPLIHTLEKDCLYKIEISICLDKESNIAIKNFGIYFSNSSSVQDKEIGLLNIAPQVKFDSIYIDNTDRWITLHSLYKAIGIENYIVLGNFMNDKYTSTKTMIPIKENGKIEKWKLNKNEKTAYYYIDNVDVEKMKVNTTIAANTAKTPANIKNDSLYDINAIKVDSSIIIKNVNFEYNKSELLHTSYNELNRLYQLLATYPNIRIKLEGYTDSIGGHEFNLQLSIKRVESVFHYLTNKGINANRIEYAGYGSSFPLSSNQTEEGREKNRRVTFKIIQK
jgi:outer membrane protein OmpA-like peptidoglycan-associated protein